MGKNYLLGSQSYQYVRVVMRLLHYGICVLDREVCDLHQMLTN